MPNAVRVTIITPAVILKTRSMFPTFTFIFNTSLTSIYLLVRTKQEHIYYENTSNIAESISGFPIPATDYVQDEIDLNNELIKNPPATFLIRVQGNSMTDHKIINGDLLVVDRSLNLKNDCIAIINFNNELVVKNIIKENNNFYIKNKLEKTLINENSDINVWGIVTYIIHAAH